MGASDRTFLALAFSILFLPQTTFSAEYTEREEIEITDEQRNQLLTAATSNLVNTSSESVIRENEAGNIDFIKVSRFESKPTEGELDYPSDEWTAHHNAAIYYEPVPLSDSREYRPKVACSSYGDDIRFEDCHDDSYVRLEADWMVKPIFFEGDLTDEEVRMLYSAVHAAALVSRTDGEVVTSDKIYSVRKSGLGDNLFNVNVTTDRKGYSDAIYFERVRNDDGRTDFVVSDFRCGVD